MPRTSQRRSDAREKTIAGVPTNLRRSARISERRNVENTADHQESHKEPTPLQQARQGNKDRGERRGRARGGRSSESSRQTHASSAIIQASPRGSKLKGSVLSQPGRRGTQNRGKPRDGRITRLPKTHLPQPTVSKRKSPPRKTKAGEVSEHRRAPLGQTKQGRSGVGGQISTSSSPEHARQEHTHREHTPPEDVRYIVRALEVPSDELAFIDETTPSSTRGDASTVEGRKSRSVKISPAKLRYRRIHQDMTSGRHDPKLKELSTKLKTEFSERTIEDTLQFQMLLARFQERADANKGESCYTFIDDLSYELDEEKSKIQFPITNWRYFEANLKRISMNEAILQRTIMMTVFDQYWLRDIFDWNTEGQWHQNSETRIPSSADDDLSLPKPDLTITFTRQSFTGFDISDPIPYKLEKCISPEGDNRCFPFLFMEVQKAASDLQEAYLANLNNASQALHNIYLWMKQADQTNKFFDDVRVFSLLFNAEDMSVRVHRVEEHDGNLYFFFDEVRTLARYNRNQAWVLVNNILENYAATELHPLLKSAYDTVCKQERDRVQGKSKRKASRTQSTASKRARSSESAGMT